MKTLDIDKSAINQIAETYNFLNANGVDLSRFEPSNYVQSSNPLKSSFKGREDEIKAKFNHVFNFPPEPFIYPNIETIKFVKL